MKRYVINRVVYDDTVQHSKLSFFCSKQAKELMILSKLSKSNLPAKKYIGELVNFFFIKECYNYYFLTLKPFDVNNFFLMNLNEFFSIFSKFKTYLEDILKRKEKIDHRTIIRWSNQILIGIEYLHEKNIIHGDIRPG